MSSAIRGRGRDLWDWVMCHVFLIGFLIGVLGLNLEHNSFHYLQPVRSGCGLKYAHWGLGFRVRGLSFRVRGLGFRV